VPEKLVQIRRQGAPDRELTRRRFFELVSASAAAAACAPQPPDHLLPYSRRPVDVTPGVASHYATSVLLDGFATGLIAKTREGRPIKLDGNRAHPASLGGSSIYHQALVLELYDPDRAGAVLERGLPSSWAALETALTRVPPRGEGLSLLLEPTSSPLVHSLLGELKQRLPAAQITFHAPYAAQVPGAAARELFGTMLAPRYDLGKPDVVVALDSDLLSVPYDLKPVRDFAARRHVRATDSTMNRLYVVEPSITITGSMADERLARPAHRVAAIAAALLAARTGPDDPNRPALDRFTATLDAHEKHFVRALAADLGHAAPGRSLVLAGPRQPLSVHVLAYALNGALGNLGKTLSFAEQAVPEDAGDRDLAALVRDMHAGRVAMLLVLGGNPSYDAPADLDFAGAVRGVAESAYLGPYVNETAASVTWFGPLSHPLESWGDGRAYDGTLSIAQPLIRPLRQGRTVTELLGLLSGRRPVDDFAQLRVRFGQRYGENTTLDQSAAERIAGQEQEVEARWEAMLVEGFERETAFEPRVPSTRPEAVAAALDALGKASAPAGIELDFLLSPTLHDGRFANVSWLLELPAPVIKLTWDNALFMSPATAKELGIPRVSREEPHPMVEISRAGRRVRAPAVVLPAHADGAVSIWLGYGRRGEERLARDAGFDVYPLRTLDAMYYGGALRLKKLDDTYPLAFRQIETDMHDRPLALSSTLAHYREHPDFTAEHKRPLPSAMPEYRLPGPQWAMSIDLSMCIGCSACELACQAENNLLVVGKEQVLKSRDMHWLRIDSYESGPAERGRIVHQPMLCQHCEDAPCEYVCPVNATVHSPDGLNEMVYNRCVGTRFCSNNCPYKVRRFNWFDWNVHERANQGEIELQRNPEVTVRARGVMEKCTYCVQRIRAAEIQSRVEGREILADEVVTACQEACPTTAIRFGSLTHAGTAMTEWRGEPRSYYALHETGARPRTMYLARIDNPNPERA
jgi:Fe-S-cluster-containing dehydrogenase component